MGDADLDMPNIESYDSAWEYDISPEEKYFLMLFYAPDTKGRFKAPIRGRTWLQKHLFLLTKVFPDLKIDFEDHHYGPFSSVVDSMRTQYENSDYITQEDENGPIKMTDKADRHVRKLWEKSSIEDKKIVTENKKLLNGMNLWELVGFIYSSYPETTKNSDVLYEYENTRLESGIELFRKGMVSLERAATIANKPLEKFSDILRKRKIPIVEFSMDRFREELKAFESNA